MDENINKTLQTIKKIITLIFLLLLYFLIIFGGFVLTPFILVVLTIVIFIYLLKNRLSPFHTYTKVILVLSSILLISLFLFVLFTRPDLFLDPISIILIITSEVALFFLSAPVVIQVMNAILFKKEIIKKMGSNIVGTVKSFFVRDNIIKALKMVGTFIVLYLLYINVFSTYSFALISHYLGGKDYFEFWNVVMWVLPFFIFSILLIKSLHDWNSWITITLTILSGFYLVLGPVSVYFGCLINPPLKTAELLNCAFFPITAFSLASIPVVMQITHLIFIRKAKKQVNG